MQVRQSVKEQIRAGMPENGLITLKFSHHDAQTLLKWEHEREFEYLGKLYDIVRSESTPDSILYRCWPDTHESMLTDAWRNLWAKTQQSHPEQQRSQVLLSLFFQSIFCIQLPDWQDVADISTTKKTPLPPYLVAWVTFCVAPLSPPPKRSPSLLQPV